MNAKTITEQEITCILTGAYIGDHAPIFKGCGNNPLPGYVYFLRGNNGYTKIGETNHLTRRLETHKKRWTGEFAFELIWVIITHDRWGLENRLHNEFADKRRKRKQGDWFLLTDEDIAELRQRFPCPHINPSGEANHV
jgi:predicted GIY-YIG superfamily endonuclease